MQPSRRRPGATHVRHVILGLTVAAYMITYMDRVVISAAIPTIRKEYGFSLVTMGYIISSFRWGYALFQIPGGWIGDKIGPRRALTLIVGWWSVFTSATAFAWSAVSMIAIRFLFGVGEAGAFPIATRSLSYWILPAERGFAQGITHAGSRLGAAMTPTLVVLVIANYGWRTAFVSFGMLGVIWSAVWYWYYRDTPAEHALVGDEELHLITGSLGEVKPQHRRSVPWRIILASREVQYVSVMYLCYGYCLAVYLDWFPTYLNSHRGYNLLQMGFYASLPLLAGVAGDLLGGWISDIWAKRTGNLKLARRVVAVSGFLLAAGAILPATLTTSPIACVWYSCVAFFGLEVTVGVSWAVPLDIGADYAGSVSAVMNTCGNIGGAISPLLLTYLVGAYGWNMPFLVAAGLSLTAAALFWRIDASRKIFAE
jgi:MFS transporter, ACS family, glucarate transporter